MSGLLNVADDTVWQLDHDVAVVGLGVPVPPAEHGAVADILAPVAHCRVFGNFGPARAALDAACEGVVQDPSSTGAEAVVGAATLPVVFCTFGAAAEKPV
ncbi:hypothetical protein PG996_000502 [Apiospora saccharicola]|uniref:Uncharacterized protein n=1 Tax=Apiospora saccharicola TaxID=335842 RepID=A0ABR1WDY1_9PEZI